ncbi:MAG TPA: zf-HC2 domain-containing protein [Gemmatimonadales bacterium]
MSELSPLRCHETFERLADYVDRELSPEDMRRVQDHLDQCAVCAREFRFEAAVLEMVREKICRIHMPPDLVARITQALARERRAGPEV